LDPIQAKRGNLGDLILEGRKSESSTNQRQRGKKKEIETYQA
jgi:hypothetical protein